MKKVIFCLATLLGIALSGCSDNADIIAANTDDTDFTSDDLLRQGVNEYAGWQSSSNYIESSRSSVNVITLQGYTSKESEGNQKVYILKDLANLMDISSKTYIVEYVTAYQNLRISGLGSRCYFATTDSPLCGTVPNSNSWEKRGYLSSIPTADGEISLTSKCIHVICDMSGITYDKWYPCKPEQFKWNYLLINL